MKISGGGADSPLFNSAKAQGILPTQLRSIDCRSMAIESKMNSVAGRGTFSSTGTSFPFREVEMDTRKVACLFAASLLGLGITAAATGAEAKPRSDVTVTAVDPTLQRRVSYADLNLALKPDQRVLRRRISYTASDLCYDLNGEHDSVCRSFAIDSTRGQVKRAIARAERLMAGLAVGPPIAISMVIGVP